MQIRTGGLPLPYPAMEPVSVVNETMIPKPRPLEGVFAPNTLLRGAVRLFKGQVLGSESVGVAGDGSLVMCDRYGAVWKAVPSATSEGGYKLDPAPVAYLAPGRPLGFHLDHQGDLIVCNAGLGLVKLELGGERRYEILTTRVSDSSRLSPGTPLNYVNDLDIAHSDGSIYFSDSGGLSPVKNRQGFWDTMSAFQLIAFQGKANGRLLKYSPATRETTVLAEGFWFPNGVALSADESFLAVVETNSMRVWRLWLKGPKEGRREVLVEGLPGFPDGMTRGPDGNFWVAIVVPKISLLVNIMPYRFARFVAAWLPPQLKPPIPSMGLAFQISPDGEILQVLMDPDGSHVSSVSGVTQSGKRLFLGNLGGDYVSYLDMDDLPRPSSESSRRVEVKSEL
eukprot:jgi/Botrbrau1/22309/Bobra.0138s0060.2